MEFAPHRGSVIADAFEFSSELKALCRTHVADATAKKLEISTKLDKSFVTSLDTDLERALRSAILKRFPQHGVVGEELGSVNTESDFVWTIDPIDGTEELVNGVPLYGTIIALLHKGQPVVGFIDHPALDIYTVGAQGLGVFRNGRRLSQLGELNAVPRLYLGSRHQFVREGDSSELFEKASRRVPNVRIFCTCYGFTGLVNGEADVAVEFGLKIWDLAAAELLVKEVGGEYVSLGEQVTASGVRLYGAAFGKRELVRELVAELSK